MISLKVETQGRNLYDITENINDALGSSRVKDGLVHLFIHHTSASLVITENADPAVHTDLIAYFDRLVPDGDPLYTHTEEGPDDMSAHVKASLTHVSLSVPMKNGKLDLGTWQGVYLFEHRKANHNRRVTITVLEA